MSIVETKGERNKKLYRPQWIKFRYYKSREAQICETDIYKNTIGAKNNY